MPQNLQQKNNLNTTQAVIYIKGMVGSSCIKLLKQELERTGFIEVLRIELGEAEIQYDNQIINPEGINSLLKHNGFELIPDNNSRIAEQIKIAVINLIFYGNNGTSIVRNSDYLSEKIGHPYPYLSKLFSEKTGITLEKYIILIKVEKIKELIIYDELTLSEIAYILGYSSVQYLSNQFKDVTGMTVSEYKNLSKRERTPLNLITG